MLFRRAYSDKEIVRVIEKGGQDTDACLAYLYHKHQGLITKFVLSNSGTDEEAHDIFQEAIVVFYEQVKNQRFALQSRISTYLYAVSRNLWFSRLKKKQRNARFNEIHENTLPGVDSPIHSIVDEERSQILHELMSQLREDCQKILHLSIFERLPMKEVYVKMGFKNEQIARNKKYKCLNYLKKLVQNSVYMPDMVD